MKKNENKTGMHLIKGSLVAGALFGIAALGAATTSSLYDYEVMGSGAEVRADILNAEVQPHANYDMTCGENSAKSTEAKSTEAKCGEGKCGEKAKTESTEKSAKTAKETKKEAKAKAKAEKGKAKEAKCGEGKCGEGKSESK